MSNHGNLKNEIGNIYGRLTVIEMDENSKSNRIHWICVCSCSKLSSVAGDKLRSGHSKSCGCLVTEVTTKRNFKHGHKTRGKKHKNYSTWLNMRDRCNNPNNKYYHNYGFRGIKVCERWDKFENFLADMGKKPEGLSLDRRENNGHYCPENCRWSTREDQMNNTRVNHIIEIEGEKYTIAQLARKLGVKYMMLFSRIDRGQPIDDLLNR